MKLLFRMGNPSLKSTKGMCPQCGAQSLEGIEMIRTGAKITVPNLKEFKI